MKLPRTLLATLLLVPLAALGPGPAAAAPAAEGSATVEVFATGLVYPRGLEFGPGGQLYVAEAGPGGEVVTPGTCPGYTSPFEPYHSALTARISKLSPGGRTTVAGGLPSARDRFGDVLGAAPDVVVRGRTVYALVAGGGCSRGLGANPVGDLGEIDKVNPASGQIRRVLDISATHPHITPTALARRGGHLYVGNLGSFPIQRGASVILRVTLDGRHQRVVASGLTAVLGLAFDRSGRLYALETTTVNNDFPQPGTGRVVRVTGHGLVPVATGLTFPTAMTTGPDGHLYVSEHGYGGDPAAGRILRIRLR